MTHVNGGLAVVRAVEASGITTAFGIPGTHNLEIYRHLPTSTLLHFTMRHEQGMGYAADGYARITGRPAVCFPTSGPGLANMAAAVATAHADSVPLLVVAPGPVLGQEGGDLGRLHEMHDQFRMMTGIVHSHARPRSPEEATQAILDAVWDMAVCRPRPAYVEIPLDVLQAPWSGQIANRPPTRAPWSEPTSDIEAAAAALNAAPTIVIVLGGGARGSGELLASIAECINAPVITTVNAKGVVDESHPLSMGASLRVSESRELISGADAVLMVGTEWSDSDLWGGVEPLRGTVVRIDIDPKQLQKNVRGDITIQGDAREVLDLLAPLLSPRIANQDWSAVRQIISQRARHDGRATDWIQRVIREIVPEGLIICGDSAQVSYFGTVHHLPMGLKDQFLYPTGFATLGYGLPAAIGAKIADPQRSVVVVVGDGGFVFTMQELLSAVSLGMPLPILVVDNGGFKQIRDEMLEREIVPTGVSLDSVDLQLFAQSAGARFALARNPVELHASIQSALAEPIPTLIDIPLIEVKA
jgi:acetolactate synthase-1/2/3 large subunit